MTQLQRDVLEKCIFYAQQRPKELAELLETLFEKDSTGPTTITSGDITDATDVGKNLLKASTQANARTAIGAGTSNLKIGTTANDAKSGDYNYVLPSATTTVLGGVKKAATVGSVPASTATDIDGVVTSLNTLTTAFNTLVTNLKTGGSVA